MTYTVKLSDFCADEIIQSVVRESISDLENDTCSVPYFSQDKKEEKKYKKKLIKALKITEAWYSVGGNLEELLK